MKKIGVLFLIMMMACTSSKNSTTTPSTILTDLVTTKQFSIISQWANPQNTVATSQIQAMGLTSSSAIGGRIEINGIINYLTLKNDSVFASLPYYGERRMSSGTGSIDQGIIINGIPNNLEIEQKGSTYILKFNVNDSKVRNERYDIRLKLNSNLSSTIDINSTHRSGIRYEGKIIKSEAIE